MTTIRRSLAPAVSLRLPDRRPVRACAVVAVMFAAAAAAPPSASAQRRPPPVAELTAGWVGFADDGIVGETLVGGSARIYLLPRVSVGPELTLIQGRHHSHLVVTGNVTVDLLRPAALRPGTIVPFIVVGGGLFQTRERFGTSTFTGNEGAFTVGGGVRASVTDRVALGIDARLGWEPHFRIAGLVSVQLGQ